MARDMAQELAQELVREMAQEMAQEICQESYGWIPGEGGPVDQINHSHTSIAHVCARSEMQVLPR